jgi:hypothetical protein
MRQRARRRAQLGRIERAREIGAPYWVIKHEQAQLARLRKRRSLRSKFYAGLLEKHVYPVMNLGPAQ